MKILFKFLLITAIAFALVFLSYKSQGQVIIYFHAYRIDISLTATIILLVIAFVVIYYLIRGYVNFTLLPMRLRKLRQINVQNRSRKHLLNAIVHYFEGKYGSSYKSALNSIKAEKNQNYKFIALLLAFKASGFMRSYEREDELSAELEKYSDKKWMLAKLMSKAESDYTEQRYGLCLDNLNRVIEIDKKHIPAHRIMLKTYLRLENYEKAYQVLNWLIKHDFLEEYKAENYKLRVLGGIFESQIDLEEIYQVYRKLHKVDQHNPLIIKYYMDALIRNRGYSAVIDLVIDTKLTEMGYGIVYSLVKLSKKLSDEKEIKELYQALTSALTVNRSYAKLLLALGILSYLLKDNDKAKNFLEESLALEQSRDGYLYLSFVAKELKNNNLNEYALSQLIDNINELL